MLYEKKKTKSLFSQPYQRNRTILNCMTFFLTRHSYHTNFVFYIRKAGNEIARDASVLMKAKK